jgi:hypothetical protein
MLRMLSRSPRKIDTAAFARRLCDEGDRGTRRTLPRDLQRLARPGPLRGDAPRPAGWSWAPHAALRDLPGRAPTPAQTILDTLPANAVRGGPANVRVLHRRLWPRSAAAGWTVAGSMGHPAPGHRGQPYAVRFIRWGASSAVAAGRVLAAAPQGPPIYGGGPGTVAAGACRAPASRRAAEATGDGVTGVAAFAARGPSSGGDVSRVRA